MSRGNPNKRKGTAAERELWKKLQADDPCGKWQSRTRLADGSRRPSPPTHGFDLWSDARGIYIECKIRNRSILPPQIESWCVDACQRDFASRRADGTLLYDCYVAYRVSGSQYWMFAWFHENRPLFADSMLLITAYDFWLAEIKRETKPNA